MKQQSTTTVFRAIGLFCLVALITVQAIFINSHDAYAAGQITSRSLQLLAGDNNTTGINGGSLAGRSVRHKYTFTVPTAGNVGSVVIQYCTTAADVGALTCVGPTGLSTSTASIDGAATGLTGLSYVSVDANTLRLTRAPGAAQALGANTVVSVTLNNIMNPSVENTTFFARISTFASTDGSGTAIDAGTVAASTTKGIDLSGVMPESLVFCTGNIIPLGAGNVPNCTDPAITNLIKYNQLFSPVDTATATSQMAASTNAGFGYVISVNGPTLTSGPNTITGITAPDTSKKGVSQFGLNLMANTVASATAPFGIVLAPVSDGLTFNGQPTADYATQDKFKFVDGDIVANSNSKGTDSQVYTVSYIANVPGSLPAGTYSTTLTYICTPTY